MENTQTWKMVWTRETLDLHKGHSFRPLAHRLQNALCPHGTNTCVCVCVCVCVCRVQAHQSVLSKNMRCACVFMCACVRKRGLRCASSYAYAHAQKARKRTVSIARPLHFLQQK